MKYIIEDRHIFLLFYLGICLHIIFTITLPVSLSADSFQYLKLSNYPLSINDLENRTLGYPLFIYILRIFEFLKIDLGILLVIFLQSILMIILPIIIYKSLIIYSEFFSKIISMYFCIFIYPHWMSNQIMTESLFIFMLALVIYNLNIYFSKNNFFCLFVVFFAMFLSLLIRPTAQLFFYIFPIIFIFYSIKFSNKNRFLDLSIVCVLSIIILLFYNITTTKTSKFFAPFNIWHSMAAKLCDINDQEKIDEIIKSNIYNVPDDNNYYLITKKYQDLNPADQKYLFKEKCIKYGNGPRTNEYFEVVAKSLDTNIYFRKILTSTYDVRGAPEDFDESLVNLSSFELVQSVHEKYLYPLPFMHIIWNLPNIIGFEDTLNLIYGVLLETYINNKTLIFDIVKHKFLESKIFNFDYLFVQGKKQGKMDMNYWRFVPSPYENITSQGLQQWYEFSPKIYLQNIYTLEKLSGDDIYQIYKKGDTWSIIEGYFEENSLYKLKMNFIKQKNISNISLEIFYRINFLTYFFIKIFVLIILPFYLLFKFISFFISLFTKKTAQYEKLFISSLILSLVGYGGIIISLFIFYDERHIMMHIICFTPLAMCFLLDIKKKLFK